MLEDLCSAVTQIMTCASAAGFDAHREFFPDDLMKKRSVYTAIVSVTSQKDIAECMVGDALQKEIESVIEVKLLGKMCAYSDAYELEDMGSALFAELASSGELLSRVTSLSQIKQNGRLGRLELDIGLTLRTLEIKEAQP